MNGAQVFVQELQRAGVTFIATLCGHGLDPFFQACLDAGIRLVDVRNEQAAAYMAECYGRLTRQIGVCAVSSGVAHANAMTGVVNAAFDGAPMLLLTGSGALRTSGMGHFQDLDQVALAMPVCKYARTIDVADRIPQIVHEALTAATSGRPGPVHLTFPLDIQEREVRHPIQSRATISNAFIPAPGEPALIAEAARWLGAAERPLLVAGSGVYYAQGETALKEFTEICAIPVMVPIWDRGAVSEPNPAWMGVVGAATGGPALMADADVIVLAGATCDYRVGYLQAPAIRNDAQVIRIDADAIQLSKGTGVHMSILGDPRSVLTQLASTFQEQGHQPKRAWLDEAQSRRDQFRSNVRACSRTKVAGRLHALDIMDALQQVLTPETVLVIDGGNIGQWAHQTLCDYYPGHWLSCGASAVVGYGLPGAMAACLSYPDRPVILLSGDGAIAFTIAELEAAVRQHLNFVVIVADDEAWGITFDGQMKQYGQPMGSALGPIRFDMVARGFGAEAVNITDAEALLPAIQQGLTNNCPTLIHVPLVKSQSAGSAS